MVGPSPVFMDYIGRVLPSLGEDSVTLHSLGQAASDVLGVSASRLDRGATAVAKGSLRVLPVLKRLVELPVIELPEGGLRLTVKGEVFGLSLGRLAAIRHQALSGRTYHAARPAAERAAVAELWRQPGADQVAEGERHFADLVTESAGFAAFLDAWWPPLEAADVLRRLADPATARAVAADDLAPDEVEALVASYGPPDFSVADIALLDELAALLGPRPRREEPDLFLEGFGSLPEVVTLADRLAEQRDEADEPTVHSTYAHVLVDEAQDVTPMQWRMLRRRGAQASWTIVGDPALSSWPDPGEAARSLAHLVGTSARRDFRLSTNYRSP
ncbi:MAG: AAA family ATPase, partial [Propionibacteriaceae bacterium]|nr:AAA family ATPase [Propionibacteriaceae bacterium]